MPKAITSENSSAHGLSAAIQQKDAAWADALFPLALASNDQRLSELLDVLTPENAERHLETLFELKNEDRRQLQASLLARVTHSWSAPFSRKVLAWLRAITALESFDRQMRNQLVRFVPRLAPETLREMRLQLAARVQRLGLLEIRRR